MDFGQQYLAVAAVLGLLGGGLWWLRRHGYAARALGSRRRSLESLERLALSPQHTLHVVRAGTAVMLLACSPQGCQILREIEPGSIGGAS